MTPTTLTLTHPAKCDATADRSLRVAVLLTASGGFLDAFTYVGHGRIFVNVMSGNVVFLAYSLVSAHWSVALHVLPPILAFLLGVFVAQLAQKPILHRLVYSPVLNWLALEILVLAVVSVLPPSFPDMLLVPCIALVAAIQSSSFNRVECWTYNSAMTTGNLTRFVESLYSGLILKRDPEALHQARVFALICLSFFAGGIIGAYATSWLHNLALWLPIVALGAALCLCWSPSTSDTNGNGRLIVRVEQNHATSSS